MKSAPRVGPRYWAALCLASIFGCNSGDFVSFDLGLGHWRGLPVLACALALILAGERRAGRASEAWYWLAIVVIRTAATNLSDLATHDFRLSYVLVMAGLAAMLAGLAAMTTQRPGQAAAPAANGWFWAAMLVAGTLGTASGDYLAGPLGLGVAIASGAMTFVLIAALLPRTRTTLSSLATFWVAVVAIRTWGTNVGDLLAHSVGLERATALSGALLLGLLLFWRTRPKPALAAAD